MVRIPFNAFSTAPYSSCTLYITVRSTRLTTPTAIPRDEISTGYISAFQEFSNASEDATRTSAAHVASANEPKRSAPYQRCRPHCRPRCQRCTQDCACRPPPNRTHSYLKGLHRHRPLSCKYPLRLGRKAQWMNLPTRIQRWLRTWRPCSRTATGTSWQNIQDHRRTSRASTSI